MPNQEKTLTAAAIKYLLAIGELCRGGRGARCVDVAARIQVSKPGAHAMIRNLCDAGLAEKERYGIVYLTEPGRAAAERYAAFYQPLFRRMQAALGLEEDACRDVACAVLAQEQYRLEELALRLSRTSFPAGSGQT